MFDIGFWELLVIAVVLLLVLGPERLPEVAKQAAFWVRKVRTGMHRLRSEMKSEMEGTPFADLQKAKEEVSNFKNDMQQFGRDLADSANQTVASSDVPKNVDGSEESQQKSKTSSTKKSSRKKPTKQVLANTPGKKKVSKKKVAKQAVRKKATKKKAKKKRPASPVTKA